MRESVISIIFVAIAFLIIASFRVHLGLEFLRCKGSLAGEIVDRIEASIIIIWFTM